MKINIHIIAFMFLFSFNMIDARVCAQESMDFWTLDKREINKLEKLRVEDPQSFQENLSRRRERMREKLEALRMSHPEAFQRNISRRKKELHDNLEQLDRRDPQRLLNLIERRREQARVLLQQGMRRDPARFQKIIEHLHNEHKRKLEEIRTTDPQHYNKLQTIRQRDLQDVPESPRHIPLSQDILKEQLGGKDRSFKLELEEPSFIERMESPGLRTERLFQQKRIHPAVIEAPLKPIEVKPLIERKESRDI
ncbi:MAG: hypothetical protein K8S27_02625 [Candidatus Omnitrophica bacterium]|nr:hypothetical protein [Candidatus Omnitrophota bacterium]